MSTAFEDATGTVAAVFSAVAAGLSWWSSRKANLAAARANQTAETMAMIERDRRHAELRPQLDIRIERIPNTDVGLLRLDWVGPEELAPFGPLNVTVTIRDDQPGRAEYTRPGGPSAEEVAAQVWGPWRLRPGVDDTDRAGRSCANRAVPVGEELVYAVERSLAPHWYGGGPEAWRRDYRDKPVRLRIAVAAASFEPWVFLREVDMHD